MLQFYGLSQENNDKIENSSFRAESHMDIFILEESHMISNLFTGLLKLLPHNDIKSKHIFKITNEW